MHRGHGGFGAGSDHWRACQYAHAKAGGSEENAPQARDQSQVEVEDVHQPLDGSGRLVGEDLDQVWAGLVARRLECVIVELLDAVANLCIDLRPGEGTVDSGCGLGGVASHEVCAESASAALLRDAKRQGCATLTVLVKEHYIASSKVDGVGGAQAGYCRSCQSVMRITAARAAGMHTASTDDNDSLGHDDGCRWKPGQGQKMRRVQRAGEQRKSLGERRLLCMHAACASEVDNALTRMPRPMAAGPMRQRVFVRQSASLSIAAVAHACVDAILTKSSRRLASVRVCGM